MINVEFESSEVCTRTLAALVRCICFLRFIQFQVAILREYNVQPVLTFDIAPKAPPVLVEANAPTLAPKPPVHPPAKSAVSNSAMNSIPLQPKSGPAIRISTRFPTLTLRQWTAAHDQSYAQAVAAALFMLPCFHMFLLTQYMFL